MLRIVGGQLVEQAVDQRDAPQVFASKLLANAEVFSVGMYLAGLSGLAFLWFAWALREKLREEDTAGMAEAVAFGSAVVWGTLTVAAAALAATAPVLADYFKDPEGARLVTNLEFAAAPLALTLFGAFALGNGLALRRASLVPPWLAWSGVVLGFILVVAAALQPIAEPTVSRSEEEVHHIVSSSLVSPRSRRFRCGPSRSASRCSVGMAGRRTASSSTESGSACAPMARAWSASTRCTTTTARSRLANVPVEGAPYDGSRWPLSHGSRR